MSTTSQQPSTATTSQTCGCDGGLERVRFFPRQMIGADDLNQEQNYHRQKLRMHNRLLHGWGVVCGCGVAVSGDQSKPLQVQIAPGFVITPLGDEILIATKALFDLGTCATQSSDPCVVTRPCPPLAVRAPTATTLYLGINYVSCPARPVRVTPVGCACDEVECEYSRIRDGYQFVCLTALPSTHTQDPIPCQELCYSPEGFPCPPMPTDGVVVLATITLSAAAGTASPSATVDSAENRHLLYSTANIQALGICLCRQSAK